MTQWCSLDEAVRVVESGHRVFMQGACATPIGRIDFAVSWDGPLYTIERTGPSQTQRRIGEHVARLIEDGATRLTRSLASTSRAPLQHEKKVPLV